MMFKIHQAGHRELLPMAVKSADSGIAFLTRDIFLVVAVIAAAFACLTGQAASFGVDVIDSSFIPGTLSINVGDQVVWTGQGGQDHNVVAETGIFDSRTVFDSIPFGETFTYKFLQTGIYNYYCTYHGTIQPELGGMFGTITVTGTVPENHPPTTPVNQLPAAGATNQPVLVQLRGSVFADPDAGDTHAASQWIIRRESDNQLVYDSGEVTASKTNLTSGLLNYGTSYSWQVRYKDSAGSYSAYSLSTSFSTLPPTLNIVHQGTNVVFFWPTNTGGFSLEYGTSLPPTNWISAAPGPAVVSSQNAVTNVVGDGTRFYRLSKPLN